MKTIALLFFPYLGFAQMLDLKDTALFNNRIEISIPSNLYEMSEETWETRHHNEGKSEIALMDKNGAIEFTVEHTQIMKLNDTNMNSFKNKMVQSINEELKINTTNGSIKIINGKKVAVFKFVTGFTANKIFNCYFYVVVDGKAILFTINFDETLTSNPETTIDKITESLKVK